MSFDFFFTEGTSFIIYIYTGHKEGLTWLLDCLREAREDRQEEDGDDAAEAIPILPLTEAAVTATEDHNFLTFMAKLGMAPPANEQVHLSNGKSLLLLF